MIIREEGILDSSMCKKLIDIHNNSNEVKKFRDTFILTFFNKEVLNIIHKKFKIKKLLSPDNMEIVKWPMGSFMKKHRDTGDDISFILYLNDNYEGGETIVDKLKIKPKQGRIVIFSNDKYIHEVKKVNWGVRYTLAGWYK